MPHFGNTRTVVTSLTHLINTPSITLSHSSTSLKNVAYFSPVSSHISSESFNDLYSTSFSICNSSPNSFSYWTYRSLRTRFLPSPSSIGLNTGIVYPPSYLGSPYFFISAFFISSIAALFSSFNITSYIDK